MRSTQSLKFTHHTPAAHSLAKSCTALGNTSDDDSHACATVEFLAGRCRLLNYRESVGAEFQATSG